ncbi:MAG TPA: post-COAP-1 domain-containing protein, partial [Chthoniobacterales bacterium]
ANEYYTSNNVTFNWQTRIGVFKLSDSCTPPPQGKLAGTITACNSGAPLSLAMVQLSNGTSVTTQPANNGAYSLPLAPGNYTVTVIDPNRLCNLAGPFSVTVNANQTTTLNACLTGVAQPVVDPLDPTLEVVTGGNNTGIIDANECNNLTVIAKNIGCAPAAHVVGTLSTSTPGVTITQPTANYLDMPIDGSSANTTPFKVSTAPGFVCGTAIDFTLTLNFTGGSKSSSFSIATCTESAPPVPFGGTLQTGDLIQQARLGRNGPAGISTCAGKPCPGPLSSGNRRYDLINFVNGPVDACVTIHTDTSSNPAVTPILTKAHLGSYDPTDFCVNYLGDSSLVAATSYDFSVELPANGTLVVVVEDSGNNPVTPATPSVPYTGLVSGLSALPVPGPGICKIDTGITTKAGPKTHVQGTVFDRATLTTAVGGGPPPTGTITFRLFGPNQATCGGALAFMSTVTVNGAGTYTSDSFTPTAAGTYRWIASYSGDANYNPVSGLCNDANESEVVAPMATSVMGSGTIASPFGGEASFIVNAHFKNGVSGKVIGNVDLNDPNAGFRLTQIKVTHMSFVGDCVFMNGTAKIGRTRVTFAVEACDFGTGPGIDFFAISISNGYSAAGFIDSGDIKLTP